MTFDLCVPAYNEAPILGDSLARIRTCLESGTIGNWRVIVSDNASTDGTADVVTALQNPKIVVVRTEQKGKGCAIVYAASISQADIFGFIDADLSADPDNIEALVSVLVAGDADIVVGSRLLNTTVVDRGLLRSASSRVFNILRRALIGVQVQDSQCGLKIMNSKARDILRTCTETGWFLDIEFLAKAERAGLRIREVPVHWKEETFLGRESKLRVIHDGIGAVIAMLRIRKNLPPSTSV
jgi:glycosyltransferase involved in cell wall biosynthesis